MKIEDRYYDRKKRELLVEVGLTKELLLEFESELQKMTPDEKKILFSANIISDEFNEFADICVNIVFGKPNISKTFLGIDNTDIKHKIFDWLKDIGKHFLC